uniref:Immunoglobulin C1-set domain-containing protein n=1 Tax=Electrophorus electricus TaxID=8005 RepID=A0AAY5EYB1_ELEEL
VMMSVRKYRTSLPEKLITKSVDILENEGADYDYYVTHSSLTEPAIKNGSKRSVSKGTPTTGIDKHSVYYKYMIRSGNSIDNITDFTEVTVLDGKQIDSYSSRDSIRTPKQDWLKKLPERDQQTVKNSQENMCLCTERVSVSLNFRCSHSSVRFGCKTEATFNILNCSNEYGYDGEDLISYDWISKQWKASVEQVQHTADLWNNVNGQNFLCDVWTNVDVYIFAKRAVSDPGKLTLTCLATSFYPKDVMMSVRKYRTSLPEELITSSGVRTNDEDTYQLRKSVNILENDEEYYECYVAHSSLTEPVIINWGKYICDTENCIHEFEKMLVC